MIRYHPYLALAAYIRASIRNHVNQLNRRVCAARAVA